MTEERAEELALLEPPESIDRIVRFLGDLSLRQSFINVSNFQEANSIGASGAGALRMSQAISGRLVASSPIVARDPFIELMRRYSVAASDIQEFTKWLVRWNEKREEDETVQDPTDISYVQRRQALDAQFQPEGDAAWQPVPRAFAHDPDRVRQAELHQTEGTSPPARTGLKPDAPRDSVLEGRPRTETGMDLQDPAEPKIAAQRGFLREKRPVSGEKGLSEESAPDGLKRIDFGKRLERFNQRLWGANLLAGDFLTGLISGRASAMPGLAPGLGAAITPAFAGPQMAIGVHPFMSQGGFAQAPGAPFQEGVSSPAQEMLRQPVFAAQPFEPVEASPRFRDAVPARTVERPVAVSVSPDREELVTKVEAVPPPTLVAAAPAGPAAPLASELASAPGTTSSQTQIASFLGSLNRGLFAGNLLTADFLAGLKSGELQTAAQPMAALMGQGPLTLTTFGTSASYAAGLAPGLAVGQSNGFGVGQEAFRQVMSGKSAGAAQGPALTPSDPTQMPTWLRPPDDAASSETPQLSAAIRVPTAAVQFDGSSLLAQAAGGVAPGIQSPAPAPAYPAPDPSATNLTGQSTAAEFGANLSGGRFLTIASLMSPSMQQNFGPFASLPVTSAMSSPSAPNSFPAVGVAAAPHKELYEGSAFSPTLPERDDDGRLAQAPEEGRRQWFGPGAFGIVASNFVAPFMGLPYSAAALTQVAPWQAQPILATEGIQTRDLFEGVPGPGLTGAQPKQTEPLPMDPRLGQITIVAPSIDVASPEAIAAGSAVRFDVKALAAGAGTLDSAGLAKLKEALPEGAQAFYPALSAGSLGPSAVNMRLAPSLLGNLLQRGYGSEAAQAADRLSNASVSELGSPTSATPLAGSIVPSGRPMGTTAGVLPPVKGATGALARAGEGQGQRGGPLDFLGIPVRTAPSLSGSPQLADQLAVRTPLDKKSAAPTPPERFSSLRNKLFPGFHSVTAEPDERAWRKAAPSFGMQSHSPMNVFAPDSRLTVPRPSGPKPQHETSQMGPAFASMTHPASNLHFPSGRSPLPLGTEPSANIGSTFQHLSHPSAGPTPSSSSLTNPVPRRMQMPSLASPFSPAIPAVEAHQGSASPSIVPSSTSFNAAAETLRSPMPFIRFPGTAEPIGGSSYAAPVGVSPLLSESPRRMPLIQVRGATQPTPHANPIGFPSAVHTPPSPSFTLSGAPVSPTLNLAGLSAPGPGTRPMLMPSPRQRASMMTPPSMTVRTTLPRPSGKPPLESAWIQKSTGLAGGASAPTTNAGPQAGNKEAALKHDQTAELNVMAQEVWSLLKLRIAVEADRRGRW